MTYELEVLVEAPRQAVWAALTEETDAWWLPDFHMLGEGSRVTFEPHAGGQLVERRADGGSLLWYTVQMCAPGEALHLVGHLAPDFGGPATTLLRLRLEERGAATALLVQDALYGHVEASTATSLAEGWTQLFGSGLKPFVEARG